VEISTFQAGLGGVLEGNGKLKETYYLREKVLTSGSEGTKFKKMWRGGKKKRSDWIGVAQ